MPVYEYKCAACGSVFETLILRSTEVPSCPECDSTDVARLMSAPASCHTADSSNSTPCGHECCEGANRSCGCSGACCCH